MVKIIYKYRNWENNIQRRFVTNNEIFFASPKSLNDPLELLNIFHFESLSYVNKIKFVTKIIRKYEFWHSEQDIHEKAKTFINNDRRNDFKKLKELGLRQTKDVRRNVGIFCTTNSGDNNHMWVNYANNYQGFCIGYDFEELKAYLKSKSLLGFGDKVVYHPSLPIIIPNIEENTNQLIELCFTKLKKWQNEDEYRQLKFGFVNGRLSINSKIIKEIIIGQDMDVYSKRLLLKQVSRKYHNCKIYSANRPMNNLNKHAILIDM
jgi:hypothetical protein